MVAGLLSLVPISRQVINAAVEQELAPCRPAEADRAIAEAYLSGYFPYLR